MQANRRRMTKRTGSWSRGTVRSDSSYGSEVLKTAQVASLQPQLPTFQWQPSSTVAQSELPSNRATATARLARCCQTAHKDVGHHSSRAPPVPPPPPPLPLEVIWRFSAALLQDAQDEQWQQAMQPSSSRERSGRREEREMGLTIRGVPSLLTQEGGSSYRSHHCDNCCGSAGTD